MDLLTAIPGIVSPQDRASQVRETGDGQGISRSREILSIGIFMLK